MTLICGRLFGSMFQRNSKVTRLVPNGSVSFRSVCFGSIMLHTLSAIGELRNRRIGWHDSRFAKAFRSFFGWSLARINDILGWPSTVPLVHRSIACYGQAIHAFHSLWRNDHRIYFFSILTFDKWLVCHSRNMKCQIDPPLLDLTLTLSFQLSAGFIRWCVCIERLQGVII
jgi:hypothetical protein